MAIALPITAITAMTLSVPLNTTKSGFPDEKCDIYPIPNDRDVFVSPTFALKPPQRRFVAVPTNPPIIFRDRRSKKNGKNVRKYHNIVQRGGADCSQRLQKR